MENNSFSNDIIQHLILKGYSKEMIEQALGVSQQARTKITRGDRQIKLNEFFTLLVFIKKRLSQNFGDILPNIFLGDLIDAFEELYLESPKNYWNETK